MSTTDSRQRFLASAQRLLQQRGYNGTAISDVLADSGAPRGSLYFLFPGGKDELAAEAIGLGAGQICAAMQQLFATVADLGKAIDAVVAMLGAQLEASGYSLGCPVAPVALEDVDSARVHGAVTAAYDSWQDVIAQRLHRDGHRPARARELAVFALSAIEGALLLAKVRRDVAPLRRAAKELTPLLRAPAAKVKP
jgi:TetR/AcrR family transcriptional repressor of lmrAB and yxaGH operons